MGAVGGSSGSGLLPGDGRPDRATVLSQGPVVAGLLPSGRRPRPRAAHAERVDVRDARREGARRRDGPRLPRPVGRDGDRRSDPPPDLAAGDGRRRRLGGRGFLPPTGPSGRGARDRSRTGWTSAPSPGRSRAPTCLPGRRILWVNRLDAQKGFPIALAAFSKVLAEVPDAVLVVVGEGKDREALALLTESARARVDMRGAVPNERGPLLPRRLRGLRVAGRRAGELRDRTGRGDGSRPAGRRRPTSPATGRSSRTESRDSWCRPGTRRRSRPAWSEC